MALSTLGGGDITAHVERSIQRRGAAGTRLASVWTSLAAAGVVLAVMSLFATWYAADRTANALYSGWMPSLALALIIAGGLIVVGKQVGVIGAERRVNADALSYITVAVGAGLLFLNQLAKGNFSNAVYIVTVPGVLIFGALAVRAIRSTIPGSMLELEQVALAFAALGGSLILVKISVDSANVTSGWVWGLIASLAVIVAALAACQYLGILSLFQVALFVALGLSVVILAVLIADVVGDGWPVLTERLGDFSTGVLRSQPDDDRLGISQGLIGSFWIAVFVVLLAFPIGIAAAVYLEEYAPRDSTKLSEAAKRDREAGGLFRSRRGIRLFLASKLTGLLDIVVRNLAGVPSVVYGLLGLFLFVKGTVVTHWFIDRINSIWASFFDEEELIEVGQSTLFAGGVTLAILVLPIVIITAAEAVRAVPQSLREGAYGVGATKWEVIRSQVLPFAAPGILTGTLLALARAVGEAAPLILVGAITGRLAPRDSMFSGGEAFFGQFADRFTAMPIVIVGWVEDSGRFAGFGPAAGAAIVVLLVFVMLMNSVAVLLRNYFEKKRA